MTQTLEKQVNLTENAQTFRTSDGTITIVRLQNKARLKCLPRRTGKTIIYSKAKGKMGLWSVGTDGENEKPIPEFAEIGAWRSWTMAADGLYFTKVSPQIPHSIKFYDFKTGQIRKIADVKKPPLAYYSNLAVSPDGKKILYAREDQIMAEIMLAELAEKSR